MNGGDNLLLANIISRIEKYRSLILDSMEQEAGHSERWPFVRKRLLTFLGDGGLEGDIRKLMTTSAARERSPETRKGMDGYGTKDTGRAL